MYTTCPNICESLKNIPHILVSKNLHKIKSITTQTIYHDNLLYKQTFFKLCIFSGLKVRLWGLKIPVYKLKHIKFTMGF